MTDIPIERRPTTFAAALRAVLDALGLARSCRRA